MSNPDAKRLYRKAVKNAASVIDQTRDNFYCAKLKNCEGDSKKTYVAVNKLLNKEKISSAVPSAYTNIENANNFKDFFKAKVEKIYNAIEAEQVKAPKCSLPLLTTPTLAELHSFD